MGTKEEKRLKEKQKRNAELYLKYVEPEKSFVLSTVRYYAPHYSDVEELYSGCMENFLKYIHTYDSEKPVRTWLQVVIKRYIHNEINKPQIPESPITNAHHLSHAEASEFDVEPQMICVEDCKKYVGDEIYNALSSLKPIYSNAFLLYAGGSPMSEIMEILYARGELKEKNIQTVKSRVFIARKTLREKLKEYEAIN